MPSNPRLTLSFLSGITYDPLETWLLPKSDMLCMIRCQEEPPEDAREDGEAAKFTDEENQRKQASSPSRPRTSGQVPGHPAPGATIAAAAQMPKPTGPGHPASSPDIRPQPGNPAKSPDIRRHATEHPEVLPSSPDIRPLLKPRTSGHPCLRTVRIEARVPLRPPRLYILLLLHLSRVSIGLAHL